MSHLRVGDPGFWTNTSWIQLGYGIWVNLSYVSLGLAMGFSAVIIPQLAFPMSNINPTTEEQSWIASVLVLASPLGCLISGLLMDELGRRPLMVLCNIPICTGWFYTGMASSALDIIIGRIITGVGGGMVMGCPRAYLTEISLPNMRGVIGSIPNVAMALGITSQAGLSMFWDWREMCFFCTIFSGCLLVLNFFLPETPYFNLMKGNIDKAEKNLKRFRGKDYDTHEEMEDLIEYKYINDINSLSLIGKLQAIFKLSACKPFFLIVPYLLIAQLSGISILIFWTIDMLQNSRSNVNSEIGNLLIGCTRLCSGVLVAVLIFKVGRRPLALISAIGVGIVCVGLGLFIMYTTEPSVFPQIAYMFYTLLATLGYYTLPPMIMFELYPLQVRGLLGGISVSILNIVMFGAIKSYPYVRNAIGFPFTIIGFGVCSLLGSIFLYLLLPETKGLTLQEIEEYFNNRRPTLRSQRDVIEGQLGSTPSNAQKLYSRKSLIRHKPKKKDKDQAQPSSDDHDYDEGMEINPSTSSGAGSRKSSKNIAFKDDVDIPKY